VPKLNLDSIPQTNATGYPSPFDADVKQRWYRRLAPASGLTCFGASHVVLKPGAWSSQRHWHDSEDELLVMVSGKAVLVEDEGRTMLRAGDVCAWPAGVQEGHHLINESDEDCVFVVISGGERTTGSYSDIDMVFTPDAYLHRDGTPYPAKQLR
jgi:uncharacterized cupin superfamily protein